MIVEPLVLMKAIKDLIILALNVVIVTGGAILSRSVSSYMVVKHVLMLHSNVSSLTPLHLRVLITRSISRTRLQSNLLHMLPLVLLILVPHLVHRFLTLVLLTIFLVIPHFSLKRIILHLYPLPHWLMVH